MNQNGKVMETMQIIPKSKVETLRKRLAEGRPVDDLRYVETRVKSGHGNNSRLLRIKKDDKVMI